MRRIFPVMRIPKVAAKREELKTGGSGMDDFMFTCMTTNESGSIKLVVFDK